MNIRNGEIVGDNQASVKAFGALGNGVKDDTADIQRAINTLSIISFPPGVYCCNGLVVPSHKTLTSSGSATLLLGFAGGSESAQAITIKGSHVTFRHLTVEGDNKRWASLIDLDDGDLEDISFEHCIFKNLAAGLRVRAPTIANRTVKDFYVRDCRFENFNSRAVDLLVSINGIGQPYSVQNMHIEDCHFEDIAPNSSGKNGQPGSYDGAIYIGGLNSVTDFYLCDNVVYRAGPQFLAMSATSNPRDNFIVRGNTVKQEGTEVFINMGYTFNGVNNLIFSGNTLDFSDYELLFLNDCKNYKVSDCHFSRANVGIAIHERTATADSYGEIANCTFEDIETPSAENNGNKGILIIGDVARLDVVNCRFHKRNGTKNQIGIDSNFFSSPSTRPPRLPLQVTNCTFENLTGIVMRSGGNINYPGNAKVTQCNFRKCPLGISVTYPFGSYVAFNTFDQCDSDVRSKIDTPALRALTNTHINTNPNGVAGNGAYVVELGSGLSLMQIEACDFRAVKGVFVVAMGNLLAGSRMLIWNNNNADANCTGVPVLGSAIVKQL